MIYTVIGLYKEDGGRYATTVEASSPEEAEEKAQEKCREDNKHVTVLLDLDIGGDGMLDIAAVIEGDGLKIVA